MDKTPPLSAKEIDHVLACYRTLKARRPDWAGVEIVAAVTGELKRAKRKEEADRFQEDAYKTLGDDVAAGAALALAAERGDVDAVLKLIDKQFRKEGPQTQVVAPGVRMAYAGGGMDPYVNSLEELMTARADKKAPADVLKLLDYFFDWYVHPDRVSARLRAHQTQTPYNQRGNVGINIKMGKTYRYVNIDYPTVNRYYDDSAIQMLRMAYELYKRDDLMSDLFAHIRKWEAKAPEAARVYPLLALAYLHWWNDDKDEALRELTRAGEAAKADPDLQLELADLRARRNETDEALALVDAVEPLDQKTMQRREIMALRLAVLSGNVERARVAAERLFNLRLDTDTQVRLAAQMHQLGMNDLAEAVLARARRRAGGNTQTLVALMHQYQEQNQMDIATQVAYQILRHTPARQFSPFQNNNDMAHTEAIQVLARSGKLQELIDRVEAQLKTSPNSVQLLQTLADYHQGRRRAGQGQGGAPAHREAAPRRRQAELSDRAGPGPRGRRGRLHPALQDGHRQGTGPVRALRYWEIQQAFQRADKLDDLGRLFEDVDIKKLGNNFWSIEQLVSSLLQNDKTRERGMVLFRKMWKAFPQQRANMIANFSNEEIWKLPEMYDHAREAIIPTPALKHVNKWAGIDQIFSWGGGGQVNGVADHLLGAAAKQNKLEALAKEIEEAVKRVPEWTGGKAYLALIHVRRGKHDEAQKILKELLANDTREKDLIPYAARIFIGQELENYGQYQATVLTLYEAANKQDSEQTSGMDFEYHPVRRLVALYKKAGRAAEARDLVLKFSKRSDPNNYGNNAAYEAYQRIESLNSVGRELIDLGYPADAVPLFNEALSDPEALRMVAQFYGGGSDNHIARQLREGLNKGLGALNEKNLPQTVRALLKSSNGPGGQALDLVLLIHPREADRALLRSLFAESIQSAASHPELRAEVKSQLDTLAEKHPKDFSALIPSALLAATAGDPAALIKEAERLVRLADEAPLEDLSAGVRANSRQRTEAGKRLGLWLVARECWKQPATREAGDRLAAHALEAARRQNDPLWGLSMLREWGKNALDRGDRATAELRWAQMLDLVLATPSADKAKTADAKPAPRRPTAAVASTTLDRFESAAQLSKLAAGNDMIPLSLRAVRRALVGGPPVVPMAIDENNNMGMRRGNRDNQEDSIESDVEAKLAELNVLWQRHQAPAAEVYAALRDGVLPEGRPAEIFLYPRPLAQGVRQTRSVGETLAHWAARAGTLDDLQQRVEARQGQPTADFSGQVLLAQLAFAARDWPTAVKRLEGLETRLKKDTLQNSASLACLAALPALERPETAQAARAVLELAVKNLAASQGTEPLAGLHLALAHASFQAGQVAEGRKQVQSYHTVLTRTMPNYGGDYALRVRKQHLQQVAAAYARDGQAADALDILGQFIDAPAYRGGDPPLGNVLTLLARSMLLRLASARALRTAEGVVAADGQPQVSAFARHLRPRGRPARRLREVRDPGL